MTEKLYYIHPYGTTFEGIVRSCVKIENGYHIVLDRTLFYPEGGGQQGDIGRLGDALVLDTHEKNGEIIHETDAPLVAGKRVKGEINWNHRFDLMQNHSGEHILSGIICRKYNCDNIGFHMGREKIIIDFNTQIPKEELPLLEKLANEAIWENTPIEISYPTKEELNDFSYRSKMELFGEVRIVQAGRYDCCACCGTHVRFAGEIGIIKIVSDQKYKGGTRLEILCGKRALTYFQSIHEAASAVGKVLSVQAEQIKQGVTKVIEERDELLQEKKRWKWEVFKNRIEKLSNEVESCFIFEEGLSGKDMSSLAELAVEKTGGRAMVMTSSEGGISFALVSRKMDAKELTEELKRTFDCKGGGKDGAIQGKINAEKKEIFDYLQEKGFQFS